MENLVLGIGTFLLCTLFFFLAFRAYSQKNNRISLYYILLSAILIRVFISLDHQLHDWDEKYHALVGKNMFAHPMKPTLYENPVLEYDYKNWIANHIWLEKGPLPLFLIGTSVHLFGTNEFAVRLPSILIGSCAVFITFMIGRLLFSTKIALLSAFFHAIHGLSVELIGGRVSSDHVETCYNFLIELAFLLAILFISNGNRKFLLSLLLGIVVGLAILTKWFPALFIFPTWFFAGLVSKKYSVITVFGNVAIALITCSLVVFPYFWYLNTNYPLEFQWVLNKFQFAYKTTIENHNAPWFYYLHKVGVLFGELVYVPLSLGIYLIFRSHFKWQFSLLTLWWFIPILIFSFADTKRFTYIMLAAPAIFILTSFAIFHIRESSFQLRYKHVANGIIFVLILLPVRYSIERTKVFEIRDTEEEWKRDISKFNILPYDPEKTIIFNVDHAIEAMFYTNYTVYPNIPDSSTIIQLSSAGYILLEYDPERKSVKEIQAIHQSEI